MFKVVRIAALLAGFVLVVAGCGSVSGTVKEKQVEKNGTNYPRYFLFVSTGDSVEVEGPTFARYKVGDAYSGPLFPLEGDAANPLTAWSATAKKARERYANTHPENVPDSGLDCLPCIGIG